MSKINRYDGNFPTFAEDFQSQERTAFGTEDVGQDDLTQNMNQSWQRGWGIIAPSEFPPIQYFNAVGFTLSRVLEYLHQMGVAEWDTDQEFYEGSFTQKGGSFWVSQSGTDGSPNVGNDPETDDGTNWVKVPNADEVESQINDLGVAQSVDSVATLRASSFPANLERLWLSGYDSAGDGGSGPLRADRDDTTTADNDVTVFVDTDGVRWKRPQGAFLQRVDAGVDATDEDLQVFGALYLFDPDAPKSHHNGVTTISPTVPWEGNLQDYKDGVNESDPSGTGVLELAHGTIRTEFIVDVGSSARFSTVSDALGYCSKQPVYSIPKTDGRRDPVAEINIKTGYTWAEQVYVGNGQNLSFIRITSEDATVPVDKTALTLTVAARESAFSVYNGSTSPIIEIVLEGGTSRPGSDDGTDGLFSDRVSTLIIAGNGGANGFGRGAHVANSVGLLRSGNFDRNFFGARISNRSTVNLQFASMEDCSTAIQTGDAPIINAADVSFDQTDKIIDASSGGRIRLDRASGSIGKFGNFSNNADVVFAAVSITGANSTFFAELSRNASVYVSGSLGNISVTEDFAAIVETGSELIFEGLTITDITGAIVAVLKVDSSSAYYEYDCDITSSVVYTEDSGATGYGVGKLVLTETTHATTGSENCLSGHGADIYIKGGDFTGVGGKLIDVHAATINLLFVDIETGATAEPIVLREACTLRGRRVKNAGSAFADTDVNGVSSFNAIDSTTGSLVQYDETDT